MTTRRGIVERFADGMEVVLKDNDWKGGWDQMDDEELLERLREETDELVQALTRVPILVFSDGQVQREAVDVANFAMMIFEAYGG